MKKVFKVLVCTVVFLTGIVVNRQEARAQFVVSDPTNLVQSILQYIQDQIREGSFDLGEGLSKLEGMREQFKAQQEKLDQVMLIVGKYQQFKQAYSDIQAIAEVASSVTKDIMNFKDIEYLMSTIGSYQSVATVGNLVKNYGKITDSLMGEVKDEMFDLSKITQADPMTMLSELRKQTEYLYAGYGYIRSSFYDAFRQAYYDDIKHHASDADKQLLKTLLY